MQYAYEHSDLGERAFAPPLNGPVGVCPVDYQSQQLHPSLDSPGAQTLTVLKIEAINEKRKGPHRKKRWLRFSSRGERTRRRVTRSCKVLKESYFEKMAWTIVSGPVYQRWNPYKFFWSICKGKISIYGEGAREIFRHQSTEKLLRKDQKWGYEQIEHPKLNSEVAKRSCLPHTN